MFLKRKRDEKIPRNYSGLTGRALDRGKHKQIDGAQVIAL